MTRKKLEDLNLLDDFLFGSLVSYPKLGEEFVRILLKIVLQKPIGRLKVFPQKTYYGTDTDKHGTRLDVYLEDLFPENTLISEARKADEEAAVAIYDIEPDKNSAQENIQALPKRIRFYRAKIDSESLESGQDYQQLRDVVIIMIMPYDPFALDRMIYTIRTKCQEEPEMPYDDGATTLFLYTKGKKGDPPEALRQLLRFMEDTTDSHAVNDDLKTILNMVNIVKQSKEVSLRYMKQYERAKMILEEGREEGREEGIHFYIESMQELHIPRPEVESKLASKYGSADAKKYLNLYWK